MSFWNTRGLRGSAFEELINMTNQLYQQQRLAVIQKISTPITPVAVDNRAHRITEAYFEKKATVDYIGVAQGVPICFDAKETQTSNLPLRNIHTHQITFMEDFRKQRGVSFLLVSFAKLGKMFLLPSEVLAIHYDTAQAGGRKSIPVDAFDTEYAIFNKGGFPVHYLVAVNAYLMRKE